MVNQRTKSSRSSVAERLCFLVPVIVWWLGLSFGCVPRDVAAQVVVGVPGNANIFGAGHSVGPAPGGGGGGVLPTQVSIAPGTWYLTFPSNSGGIYTGGGSSTNGPDGASGAGYDISSYGGISGIVDPDRGGFLAGVFVGPDEPVDPAPTRLTFSDATIGLDSLAPELNQGFFIGDGLTGTGTGSLQKFYVPMGATRLYLGIYDSLGWTGLPGYYDDNGGQFDVTVAATLLPRLDIRFSQVEMCWQSATNIWYQLQYSSALTTNQWVPLSTNWVAGDGTRLCATDAILVGSPQRFYRLSVTNSLP